ncbi:Kunitz trypsin inhibitor, partial [Quillaja saponaria]
CYQYKFHTASLAADHLIHTPTYRLKTMKKTTSPLLVLSCFLILFPFITKPFLAVVKPVLDTDGEPLQWFTNYYVSPHIWGPTGGGLRLGTHRNKSCPLYVTQENSKDERGFPVKFSPVSSKLPFVTTSTNVNIQTIAQTDCVDSRVWRLIKEYTGVWFLGNDGIASPGIDGIVSMFKIERAEKIVAYNLVFCPGLVPTICNTLGLYSDHEEEGKRYLALSDKIQPFTVVFQKASSTSSNHIQSVA